MKDIYQSLEDFCYEGIPIPKKSLWTLTEPLETECTFYYSEDDLLEYMDNLVSAFDFSATPKPDSCDFVITLFPSIFKYEYIGEYLGEENVIRKSHLVYSEDGFYSNYESFETINPESGILKILRYTDEGFVWQSYIKDKSLIGVYEEFSNIEDLNLSGEKTLNLRKKQ